MNNAYAGGQPQPNSERRSNENGAQPPVAEFANMNMHGAPSGQPMAPPNGYVDGASAYPQPAVQYHVQSAGAPADSPGNADFGADVNSGFDGDSYGHYNHVQQQQQQYQQPQYQQQQQQQQYQQYQPQQHMQQQHMPPQAAPAMIKSRSDIDRYHANGAAPAMHAQNMNQYAANYQAHAGSNSSMDGGSSGSDSLLPPPRAPGLGLHQSASQPRLSGTSAEDGGIDVAPRPRIRPGRSGMGGNGPANGEPNPFLTYSRNSIYSTSQTSLHRGSIYGMGANNNMSAKRMSRTLVSGNNALDMYREAAKKTQDERIQMEYAKFLLQSIENLEDPVVREDINVTYSIYFPGNDPLGSMPGSAAASSASLPLGQQASEIDPANREKLITEAVYWIKHLQRKGNTEASYVAGTWFEAGKYGIEQDKSKAVQLFTYAAKNHHASAAYKVAVHHEERKSGGRAFSYFQMAAALGDVSANFRMAKVFLEGNFHKKVNIKQALVYLRRSAELANTECSEGALLLGQMYLKEYPNPAVYEVIFYDPEEAQKQLDRAARLGNIEAQYLLGYLFEFGEHGYPVDPTSSTHYYQLAAEQDNAKAQMALSGWYLSGGDGVPIDDRLAFDWGHRAAQQGLTRAMYAMGYYYEMGIGCDKDIGRARDWYERAAAAGSEEAKERLSKGISGASSAESTAALRRHVTQKRQKAAGRGKKRGGILSRDKDKDGTGCIIM
ncbi:hypothetical protein H4S02_002067 [Coemansia sp. RSA 2611]|nr:hypothetical protein H4S02_002067 [Coemansia sp. RSA 2611]